MRIKGWNNVIVFRCDKCKKNEVKRNEDGMHQMSVRPLRDSTVAPPKKTNHLCDECLTKYEQWLNQD